MKKVRMKITNITGLVLVIIMGSLGCLICWGF